MTEQWRGLPNTFTTATARGAGIHPRDLYRWRDDGIVAELSRGVFRRSDAPLASHPDLLAVAHRAPRAVVCCLSAAVLHDLTDELPRAVQIAVRTHDRPPRIIQPPVQVFRFDQEAFDIEIERHDAAPDETVRIYGPERTVVDLMRLRHRLGEPLAYIALQRYLRWKTARPGYLLELANRFDVAGPMRRALDVAMAE